MNINRFLKDSFGAAEEDRDIGPPSYCGRDSQVQKEPANKVSSKRANPAAQCLNRFKNARGSLEGEVTVSGDEMTGQIGTAFGTRGVSLRRVDSSPPAPPAR